MQVVKTLNQHPGHYADKMKYYLTKADTVTDSKEMMKLMVQITQNIKANIQNQHGLEIPAIWIDRNNKHKKVAESSQSVSSLDNLNQIETVCENIEKAIHQKVQDNLSHVERDCQKIRHALQTYVKFY
jgi:hypothetical protein